MQTLSTRTGVPVDHTAGALTTLEVNRLISRSATEPPAFRFAPATAALSAAVDELARLYGDQRAAIMAEMSINAISRIRSSSLRAFADAFVIGPRKRDSDG